MTTSQQSRLGQAPEEGMKAPVITVSTGQETLFGIGQTIASVVIGDLDRVAVAAQTDSTENGIYVARGGKDWERATDFNNGEDVINGQLMTDSTTSAVYAISAPTPWTPGQNSVSFGLLLSPVGFFWGAITGTLSNQADLQLELDAKAALVHTHVEADITDLQAYLTDAAGSIALDGDFHARRNAAWEAINFTVFAPTVHAHVEADISDLQAYLTDALGSIANDGLLYARVNNDWAAFSTASGNVGEIVAWPDDDVPDNFLDCNGQSVNAVTFAQLFAIVGFKYGGSGANFNLPDLRGTFVRGTALGSGNDPDRTSRTDRGDGATGDLVGTKQANSRASTGPIGHPSGATGGQEDRPINVNMNYIIRYAGGGSGNLPPEVAIADNSVVITTAVQQINFVGFVVTEPLDDQVTVTFGASPNSALFCPGYLFNFINTISWSIVGSDVTNLFSVGRRLQFTDGASLYFGTILTSTFSAGDTVMAMSMEAGDVLTVSVTEVCLTTSAASWSPIAADPFSSNQINDIVTGLIGSDQYWVIVGNAGRVATSTDGGLTWTLAASGTTEDLNGVAYNNDDQSFLAVGNAGEYTHSTDGTTWTADSTKFAALPEASGGSFNINSVCYDKGGQGWRAMWTHLVAQQANAYSTDDTLTWDSTPNIGAETSIIGCKMVNRVSFSGGNSGTLWKNGQDAFTFAIIPDETGAVAVNHSGQDIITALHVNVESGSSRDWNGHGNGEIFANVTDVDADTTPITFGTSAIRGFAFSDTHQRLVAVSDDGKIGFLDAELFYVNPAFTLVANGSNPLANFTGVEWNEADGLYIAVNDDGQILRSSNGLDNIVAPTFTGFTLIAADPFSGATINRIMSGAIGGDVFWVAIGAGGTLYTSIDAGVTWTVRVTGTVANLISIGYNSTDQQFFVGCAGGDFVHSTDGITWTADTTTINGISAGGGDDIVAVVWDSGASLWWCMIDTPVAASKASWTTDVLVTTFTFRDGNVTTPGHPNMMARQVITGNPIAWPDTTQMADYHSGALDITDSTFMSTIDLDLCTCLGHGPGTAGFANNNIFGRQNGGISRGGSDALNSTVKIVEFGILSGQCNGVVYSSVSARWCMVGDSGQIFTLAQADFDIKNSWIETINPFTGNITDVWYDVADDIFIAVGSNGEIGRSTDGISP